MQKRFFDEKNNDWKKFFKKKIFNSQLSLMYNKHDIISKFFYIYIILYI